MSVYLSVLSIYLIYLIYLPFVRPFVFYYFVVVVVVVVPVIPESELLNYRAFHFLLSSLASHCHPLMGFLA